MKKESLRLVGALAGSLGLMGLFASVMSAESTSIEIKLAPAFTAKQLTAPPADGWRSVAR